MYHLAAPSFSPHPQDLNSVAQIFDFWNQTAWVQISALPLKSYVNNGYGIFCFFIFKLEIPVSISEL